MEKNEIRKGIDLKWKDNEQEFNVNMGVILDKYFWNHIEKGDIIPIPLTEQWVKDFENISWLTIDIDGYFVWFKEEKIYIKYVHQLQNVVLALTGKELIKK